MTPTQMAMVAATIANDGVLMEPYLVDKIVAAEPMGTTSRKISPGRKASTD